jgi:hypothetical protein
MRFFVSDISSESATGAAYNSHGRNPWSRKSNTFPGFGRNGANRENEHSPKRLEVSDRRDIGPKIIMKSKSIDL